MEGEAITNATDEVEFLVEVNSADLEFDTAEAFLQLIFEALEHLVVVAHPDEAVDGDTGFAAGEGGIKQTIAVLEMEQRCLQTKKHRWVVAKVREYR